jgi:hypothetical protein
MKLSTATRIASATFVTAVATLSLAAPAQAMLPDPQGGAIDSTGTVAVDDGTNWTGIAAGGAGGVALLGAGVATVIVTRRHHHLPHAA